MTQNINSNERQKVLHKIDIDFYVDFMHEF